MLAVSTGQDITGILAWVSAYLFLITIFIFVLHVVIAYLAYRDANEHGMSASLWVIFILIPPIIFYYIGILYYVFAVLVIAVAYAIARDRKYGFFRKEKGKWQR